MINGEIDMSVVKSIGMSRSLWIYEWISSSRSYHFYHSGV